MNKIFVGILLLLLVGYMGYFFYKKPKYNNGETAPIIEATLLDGKQFNLEELRGKYVLIDFWGSWCAPCRKENPGLVALYNKYYGANFAEAEGFTIVSIGVENDERRWKQAIEKDRLYWNYHIAQMDRFDSPIVKAYGVVEIPTKYLLNEKGEIISVNPSVEELDRLLQLRLRRADS